MNLCQSISISVLTNFFKFERGSAFVNSRTQDKDQRSRQIVNPNQNLSGAQVTGQETSVYMHQLTYIAKTYQNSISTTFQRLQEICIYSGEPKGLHR
jgi:hypothetical protein